MRNLKQIFLVIVIIFVSSFQSLFSQCLTASNGQYPSSTFVPACSGSSETILTDGFAGEYSVVTVVTGTNYTFTSSVGTDFITISNSAGIVSYASGTTPVNWTATFSGNIRFYTHTNSSCGEASVSRSRALTCSTVCTSPSNETCATAVTITYDQIQAGFNTSSFLGCADNCVGRGYFDAFYRYDCTCTGSYTFDMRSSNGDTYLRIFSGSCCGTLVGSNDDGYGGDDPTLTLTLTSGVSYWVECGSYSSTGMGNSAYNLYASTTCVEVVPQEGQDCGWAPTICSDAQISGNSTGPGNIDDLNVINQGCMQDGEHQSQWFYFQAQTDGVIELSIVPQNGTDDYDFAIWGGLSCPPSGVPIKCSYAAAYKQINTGFGPERHYFLVDNGDVITTDYQSGLFPNEERYIIYDHTNAVVINSGWSPGDISHTVINCPSGDCQYSISLVENYGDGWDGLVFLYVDGVNPFSTTGLKSGSGDNSEDIWDDGFVDQLNVLAGQTFTVLIDNYYATTSPYTLDWHLSSGTSLDCESLPVELISFTGKCTGSLVDLAWETASENNNDYFTVEKSPDGIQYSIIENVKGAGTTQGFTFKYNFVDYDVLPLQYYRLSQTDFDGKTETFDPIAVKCKEFGSGEISIKMTDNLVEVFFSDKSGRNYVVKIIDITGRELYNTKVEIIDNNQKVYIPDDKINATFFNVIVIGEMEMVAKKMIKQDH